MLYGGHQVVDESLPPALSDTWTWDGSRWELVEESSRPGLLVNSHELDLRGRGPLMVGGSDMDGENGDVWEWSGQGWQRWGRGVFPARQAFGLAYDAGREVVVMSGGVVAPGQLDRRQDVWEWAGDVRQPADLVLDRPPG